MEIAILPQFLAIEPHFVRKGCAGRRGNRNFTAVFGDRTSFRAVAPDDVEIAILLQLFAIEPHFVRKGCISCRLVGTAPAPRLPKRNRKEGEGKRARGQEEKMWEDVRMRRCEDEQMSRCEDEQMWRWEHVKMSTCEDVRLWRWEDVKMWRWEDWAAVKMWGCEVRGCQDVRMWGCEDVWGSEDEKMWRGEDVRMRKCGEDVKMRRCEDEKMWGWEDVRMRRCEDEKVRYRPRLLEEPCAQTLSGKTIWKMDHRNRWFYLFK